MNIHQQLAAAIDKWRADYPGQLPARLQVSKVHSGELGFDPTFTIGNTSIPIDYTDMEAGAVRCLNQGMSKAVAEANSLPSWARPPEDQS